MPTRFSLALWMLLFIGSTVNASTPPPSPTVSPNGTCGRKTGGQFDYSYCIYRSPGSHSSDVLWFLHGRAGSEHSWEIVTHYRKMRATWAAQDPTNVPIVMAVSFGPQWLLTPKLSKPKTGMLEFFENSVIPELEKSLGAPVGRRLLLGESMGGFGATQLVLSQAVHFDRAVLACPALAWISPWAKFADISAWSKQNGVNLLIALSVVATARDDFATTAEWESASPLYLAASHLGPGTPPLMISIGEEDTYGFYLGARDFMNMAKARSSSSVTWQPIHGPHCSFDETASANFLLANTN